jgi:hypothetical protein
MIKFHAVMIDETGCEFGADIEALDRGSALEGLRDRYPESKCDQLESPEDTQEREGAMMRHIHAGGNWDDDGRPIFHNEKEYDND